MELQMCEIHTTRRKGQHKWQFTVEADYNVPDQREDIGKILCEQGQIQLDELEKQENKQVVKGALAFKLLYATGREEEELESMEGVIPFQEMIHLSGLGQKDEVLMSADMEDLTINPINSRKITLRTVIVLHCVIVEDVVVEGAKELEEQGNIQCCYQTLPYTRTVTRKKDVYRIKEEIRLPQNKPNMHHIIWYQAEVMNQELRLMDGMIQIKAELEVFVLYRGEGERVPVQTFRVQLPIDGTLECVEGTSEMIADITSALKDVTLLVRPDEDGEERILELEANLKLAIQIYEDCSISILQDLYSPETEVVTECAMFNYENLVKRNQAKVRIAERVGLGAKQAPILQLCEVSGSVRIEEQQRVSTGIMVEGVVLFQVIYVSEEDRNPIACMNGVIPFSYLVENKVGEGDTSMLVPYLDNIGGIVVGGREVEIKVSVTLTSMVFSNHTSRLVTSMTVKPIDYEKMNAIPGMLGIIVKDGDTLWNIAKTYYSTIESICEINQIKPEEVQPGKKLLIVKNC